MRVAQQALPQGKGIDGQRQTIYQRVPAMRLAVLDCAQVALDHPLVAQGAELLQLASANPPAGGRKGLQPRFPRQLLIQAVAVAAAILYSGVLTIVLLKVIGLVIPLRVPAGDESTGMDLSAHGEEAYVHTGDVSAIHASIPQADALLALATETSHATR